MAKILVIDDAAANREVIATPLGYLGHHLLQAGDGREGLEIARSAKPDLVIVDILMPTMSGYEFAARLRQDPSISSTPVIFYSATFLERETHALAKACGAARILSKPINPEEVLRVVDEVLAEEAGMVKLPADDPSSIAEVVQVLNDKLFQKNRELQDLNDRLEQTIAERTGDLRDANRQLREQILQRERAEEDLRQMQKLEGIGRLAGGVAHDFNNLLGVVLGRCEILLSQPSLDPEAARSVRIIEQAAERGAQLTRQLLVFGHRQVLEPKVLDLNELTADVAKLLQGLIGEDIDLQFQPDPELGHVRADPGQLEQVIMNLAVNARDAMPNGGQLTITTANALMDEGHANRHSVVPPGSYVLLAVSDTGCGMDAETRAHIFEPFFTTKAEGKGTGLGLATVYGVVKQSGGYIWAYSELGRGSTFKVYLPRVDEPAEAQLQALPKPVGGTETILVVEDDESLRKITCEFLSASGFQVLEAATPDQALRLAESCAKPIDFLLTDVVLPGTNGRELARRLAASRPQLKTLFVSGYTDAVISRGGVLETGLAFLQKPYTRVALTRKVREVLDAAPPADCLQHRV
jgi:signal transduction histidine kinase